MRDIHSDDRHGRTATHQVKAQASYSRYGSHRWEIFIAVIVVAVAGVLAVWALFQYRNQLRNPRKDRVPERFSYSLEDYHNVSPDKIGFKRVWQIAIPGEEIRALTVFQGTAWIAADQSLLPVSLGPEGGTLGQKIETPVPVRCLAVGEWPDRDQRQR
jgi:hypothetical protein